MAKQDVDGPTMASVRKDGTSQWGVATGLSAGHYSDTNLPQRDGGKRLTDFMKIGRGQSVLVIGCGPGKDTLHIADLVGPKGRVEGIDLDEHSVFKADESLRQRTDLQAVVKHHVGDVHDLSRFRGQKFDHIHVNATYHWLKDQPLFLRQAASLCASGATLGIAGGDGNMPQPIFKIRESVCEELGLHPAVLFSYPSDDELKRDLPAAGFTDLAFEHFAGTYLFDDTRAMLEWLDVSTGKQYLDHLFDDNGKLSAERAQRAKERILEEMEMFRLPTGQASILLSRLMVVARFHPG